MDCDGRMGHRCGWVPSWVWLRHRCCTIACNNVQNTHPNTHPNTKTAQGPYLCRAGTPTRDEVALDHSGPPPLTTLSCLLYPLCRQQCLQMRNGAGMEYLVGGSRTRGARSWFRELPGSFVPHQRSRTWSTCE